MIYIFFFLLISDNFSIMMEDFLTSSVMADISNLDLPKTEIDDLKPLNQDNNTTSDDTSGTSLIPNNNNPWTFSSLEDFLFYCCPECPFKISNSISFTNHALKYHPKAKDKFGDIFVPDLDELEDLQDAVKGKGLSINDITHLGGVGIHQKVMLIHKPM